MRTQSSCLVLNSGFPGFQLVNLTVEWSVQSNRPSTCLSFSPIQTASLAAAHRARKRTVLSTLRYDFLHFVPCLRFLRYQSQAVRQQNFAPAYYGCWLGLLLLCGTLWKHRAMSSASGSGKNNVHCRESTGLNRIQSQRLIVKTTKSARTFSDTETELWYLFHQPSVGWGATPST